VGASVPVRALWHEPVHERRAAAIEVLRLYVKELTPADLGGR
jgi:hypothetical protein